MNKKISLSLTISLMALTAAVTFILTLSFSQRQFNRRLSAIDRLSEKYARLDELDAVVQRSFYKDVPQEDLINGMLNGYIAGLGDKYSAYRSAEELTEYETSNAGTYTGVGITVTKNDAGEADIIAVAENGAAAEAGIVPGDVLVNVNNISVAAHYDDAMNEIGGEIGKTVHVRVRKADTGLEHSYDLTLMQIDEQTISYEMLENRIGYIRITKFRTVTVAQFSAALTDLTGRGAKGIIFDVRDNGGGLLSALESMVDPILPEGDLAFAYNKAGDASPILHSDAKSMEMPFAVLVNGNSASASELFACLMRDYAGALLVGEKTFGKGIMQTTFDLSSGGVTLTTATYATGKTPCYHGVGLEPDVLSVSDPEAETDTQLADAADALRQRIG